MELPTTVLIRTKSEPYIHVAAPWHEGMALTQVVRKYFRLGVEMELLRRNHFASLDPNITIQIGEEENVEGTGGGNQQDSGARSS